MLRPHQTSALPTEAELIPENYFQPLDLSAIYGRTASLEVDLGCGDGAFLVALAAKKPEHDFLGIERLRGRVRRATGKIVRGDLTNARTLLIETSYAIQYLLPPGSVAVFHLMFPDPWPKRRHRRRRVVTQDFLASIHQALAPNGLLHVATDQIDYFEDVARLAVEIPEFIRVADQERVSVASTFERHFKDHGIKIHYLTLRKVSPLT